MQSEQVVNSIYNLFYETIQGSVSSGIAVRPLFWRDSKRLEIDLILAEEENLRPVEIKSGQTIVPEFFSTMQKWTALSGKPNCPATIVYEGDREHTKGSVTIIPWKKVP